MLVEEFQELRTLLLTFDIPARRVDLRDEANIRWLGRNLVIRNQGHPNLDRALDLLSMMPVDSLMVIRP